MTTTFLVLTNRAFSRLAAAINASTTTLTVTAGDGAKFPSTYPFHITIEDEIMSCTARSTDSLTVVRSRQSTSAVAHPNKAYVALNITAKSVTDLNTAVNAIENDAVFKVLFNANTIIYATVDNTPLALAMAASRIVGRKSTGDIAALTAAELLIIINVEAGADVTDAINVDAAGAVMEGDYGAFSILVADTIDVPFSLAIAASRIVGRKAAGGVVALTGAEILAILSGQAGAAFDWNNRELDNIKQLNLTDPTELTISGGAITATQGFHTVDTEGNVSTDDLDTINGGVRGDILILKAIHTDREIRVKHGAGNIYLRHREEWKSFSFLSPAGSSGTFYAAGFYEAPAAEAVLTQASLTVNHGVANISHAAHLFLVAKGDGVKASGDLVLTVSGTSIDDQGNRNAADSEVIVADALLATFATNNYVETVKKWLGQVTITLSSTGGGNFNCSFNYGFVKYEDFGNRDFVVTDFECVGRSGGSDSGFNVRLFHHNTADWTYHASSFVPGPTAGNASELANMNTLHSTEQDLNSGDHFAFKLDNLNTSIDGDDSEGLICEITTGANKAVESLSIHIGVSAAPKHAHIDNTEQSIALIYDGSNWQEL